jgi:hypothetical protein
MAEAATGAKGYPPLGQCPRDAQQAMAQFHEMETRVRSEFFFQLPVIISDDPPQVTFSI